MIEARSWGGHSGSPVFVYFTGPREGFGPGERLPHARLLGLIHGHYDIEQKIVFKDYEDEAAAPVNAGIGVVMPAPKIIEALMDEELVAAREAQPSKGA